MLKYAAPALALAAVLATTAVDARTFKVTPEFHNASEVSFTSRASVVRLTGRTSSVDGFGEIDIDTPAKNPKGEVKVDLKTLDTGIPLRNEHMRGIIEAEKYPTATFRIKSLKAPKLVANHFVDGAAVGEFNLHGVTKTITVPVTLQYLPEEDKNYRAGDWVNVSSAFKIKLSDYGIQLPKPMLGIKVADELAIQVDGMAKGI